MSGAGFTFAEPWAWLLVPLPALVWFVVRPLPSAAALSIPASVWAHLERLSAERSGSAARGRVGSLLLRALAWVGLVAALAGPQSLDAPLVSPSGRDLLLAVDLSASMGVNLQKDQNETERPIAVIRRALADLIEERARDRIGLIGFASEAYLIAPLTYDGRAVSTMLEEVRIGLPGRRTDLGQAVGLGVKVLRASESQARTMLLISDGESNAGALAVRDAVRLAVAEQIRVHTVGFAKALKPSNAAALADIAKATGGRYFEAGSAAGLAAISGELDALEASETEPVPEYLRQDWRWVPLCCAGLALGGLGWREVFRA